MHDIEKSEALDKAEFEIRRLSHEAHDKEMLIDELQRRIQRLEERVDMIEFYRRREH